MDWKTEYFYYFITGNLNAVDDLHFKYLPKSVFKYRNLNERTIDSLVNNTIWLATIDSLNAPFELSLKKYDYNNCLKLFYFEGYFENELSNDEIRKFSLSENPYEEFTRFYETHTVYKLFHDFVENKKSDWLKAIEESNKSIRICSFSEINDNILLWSHYGNEHKGICIEYDFTTQPEINAFLHPVCYLPTIQKVNSSYLSTGLKMASALYKHQSWQYEIEWRFVYNTDLISSNILHVEKPKAVYLGHNFHKNPDDLKNKLLDKLKELEIPVFQMKIDTEEYRIVKELN